MSRNLRLSACLVVLLLSVSACSDTKQPDTGDWVGEDVLEDGVRVIRTLSGSVWETPKCLEEELSIGSNEEGPYLFASIYDIDYASGRFYVLDMRAPVLKVFDSSGIHLLDIGRSGEGPGEFRRPETVAVDTRNERLYVRDLSINRMNVYSLEGDPLDTWRFNVRFSGTFPMMLTHEGSLYTAMLHRNGYSMMKIENGGVLSDTLWVPEYEKRTQWITYGNASTHLPFTSQRIFGMGPSGTVFAGFSDEYRIELRRDNQTKYVIERTDSLIPVQTEEAAWHKDRLTASIHRRNPGWVWDGPKIPDFKPAFSSIVEDHDGRLWVFRAGEGVLTESEEWQEPTIIDVFDPNGRFLGNVTLPPGVSEWPDPYISGDLFIAQFNDEDGVPYLRKYRIVDQ